MALDLKQSAIAILLSLYASLCCAADPTASSPVKADAELPAPAKTDAESSTPAKAGAEPAPAEKDGAVQPGLAAGAHYDPEGTGRHEGPTGEGHLGDLPLLSVDTSGKALGEAVAPRLKLADLKGRSLMIHSGGDNYSDAPEKNGGGGERIACGVMP